MLFRSAGWSRAAEEIVQEGLDLIVGVMREEDARARALDRGACEKFMACTACGGLDGNALLFCERGDVGFADDAFDAERARRFFHEYGILAALGAQPVVEVDGDQFFKSARVQPVQERDGVASAGDGDEVRIARREFRGDGDGREWGGGAAHSIKNQLSKLN